MMKLRIGRATQVLVGANILAALIIALELLNPAAPNAAFALEANDQSVTLPDFGDTALTPPPLSQLVDMLDRPLFFVSRRLPEPAAAKPPPPPTPLRLELEGIAIAGGSRLAVLRNLNGNGLLQLAEGDTHDGWTLESVGSTSASFKRGEQVTELPLDPAAGGRRR